MYLGGGPEVTALHADTGKSSIYRDRTGAFAHAEHPVAASAISLGSFSRVWWRMAQTWPPCRAAVGKMGQ
jgi:hypothetical protein